MQMTWLCVDDLRVMVGQFDEVCRTRVLKVNAGKRKVMVLNGGEGLVYEVHADWICLETVFRNLNIWGVLWKNQLQTGQSVKGRWRVGVGLQALSGP